MRFFHVTWCILMFFDNDILLVSLSNLNTDPHPFKLMHKTSDAWKLCSTKRQVSIHNHIARIFYRSRGLIISLELKKKRDKNTLT